MGQTGRKGGTARGAGGEVLPRRLGTGLLTLYGIGIMIGAGIYVLVGHTAASAGVWAPLSFLVAALVSLPTALSFAELAARIPEAAGDSAYVEHGLRAHWLAVLVGLVNIAAGIVGGAAVLAGGVGYLGALVPLDPWAATVILGALLTVIAVIGVVESLGFAAILTLVEVVGLVMVIWAGLGAATPVPDWSAPGPPYLPGILGGALLAFFAFLGFDDMVNMAEEVRAPGRTMPRAILMALAGTTLLYALVTLAALRAVPVEELAASMRPLALVWQAGTGQGVMFLSAIAVAAALNGVLAQIVMAARVTFGLGRRSRALAIFTHAHPRFGTPVLATVILGAGVTAAALALPVAQLAEYTSLALLVVFTIVNAALIGVKRQGETSGFTIPVWVPWTGIAACLLMLAASLVEGLT